MSIMEPGVPYFRKDGVPDRRKPHAGAHPTSAGLYRTFPILTTGPHEPWCMHFEWGPCDCGPQKDEVFLKTGTVYPPQPSLWHRLFRRAS